MNTPTKSRTYQAGASHERQAFRQYIKRSLAALQDENELELFRNTLAWIDARTKRFNARPNGLQGRKPKAKK